MVIKRKIDHSFSDQEKEAMFEMWHNENKTYSQIGEKFNCKTEVVLNIINRRFKMKHEPVKIKRRERGTIDFKIEHREAMIEFRNSREIEEVTPEWRELLNGYICSIQDEINGVPTVGDGAIQSNQIISRKVMASF